MQEILRIAFDVGYSISPRFSRIRGGTLPLHPSPFSLFPSVKFCIQWKHLPVLFTLCSFSALPPLLSAQAVNLVILGEVQYPATVTDASGAARPAREGQLVADGYTLTTGKSGSIVLLFSNGSTVTLAGNTRFSVSRFFQETHRERADLENLDIEPGRSTTRLKLDYGEM